MIPSKPEDFTGSHGGFKGQEEGLGDLFTCTFVAERRDDGTYLMRPYSTPPGWRWRGLPYILERVGPDQPPPDSL